MALLEESKALSSPPILIAPLSIEDGKDLGDTRTPSPTTSTGSSNSDSPIPAKVRFSLLINEDESQKSDDREKDHHHQPNNNNNNNNNNNKSSMKRSNSVRGMLQSLFFSPLFRKDSDQLEKSPSNSRRSSVVEPISPSLDGGEEDDFSDGEDDVSATTSESPVRRSSTASQLRVPSAHEGGDAETSKGIRRKSRSAHDLDKRLSGTVSSRPLSVFDYRVDLTYRLDPGSDLNLSILPNDKLSVLEGSVTCLVDFLAPLERVDPDFIADFFYGYRYVTSSDLVLDLLIARYQKFQNPDLEGHEVVPLRVVNAIKKWVQRHPYDFAESPVVEERLTSFFKGVQVNPDHTRFVDSIFESLETYKKREKKQRIFEMDFTSDAMGSVRKKMQSIPVVRLDPRMVARQLTLREMDLFQSIELKELLHQGWARSKTSHETSPNLSTFISWFNKTTSWVATEVCMSNSTRLRVSVIKFFITVARYCASWNNYNTVFEIISGLNLPSVYRLKRTWSHIPSKYKNYFRTLSLQLDPKDNFKTYRNTLKEAKGPCLPYIGVYLNDLVYAESGTPTVLANGKVNFFKLTTISKALSSATHFQDISYTSFPLELKMQQWLSFSMVVMDEELLLQASHRVEPDS